MAHDVNINFSNHRTGTTVLVTRRLVDYAVNWKDDGTEAPHNASGTLTYPDIFANAAIPAQMLQDDLEALITKYGRIILGIDVAS